ncbi:Flagellum-specific peptidoglycan hydrolase FlgJ [Pilibacter termitis]|uniref:Peptidoglycan hydrolase n=1 Tax=Pilibacter termitis TaxID=263852 RepID=A0A1T4R965_9ENTE|nr:LysM peptidoglycan-binding domain-containing protein [Pilibacter termitis]SKA12465.1 Flagellum-specific peptidoglycan hydrolase FlgJ [Pilibacter termitis]
MDYSTRMERRKQENAQKQKKIKHSVLGVTTTAMIATPFISQIGQTTAFADEGLPQSTGAFASTESFIAAIAPSAVEICGANDLYASVMIAQAILESNGGNSQLAQAPYYNLFGVKGTYQGQSVSFHTLEYLNGEWQQMAQPFRSYGSYYASLLDNAAVLTSTSFQSGKYHYSGAWKRNTESYLDATSWLTGTYATDPTYNQKLNGLIQMYNLTQYDTPSNFSQEEVTTVATTVSTSTSGSYTVVAGDDLWTIAQTHGMTLDELMEKNGLTSYDIYVGDVLSLGSVSSTIDTVASASSTNGTYTVVSGDNLWTIAQTHGITLDELMQKNGLTSYDIYVGDVLSL